MKQWDERAICSSLSMNRMAKMPEMLEYIGRPSVWRKMRSSKMKYMLLSVTLTSYATSSLGRWNVLCLILPTVLSIASWMGMDVYRDTTSRLHGYGSVLLLLEYAFDKFVAVLKVCWNACQ